MRRDVLRLRRSLTRKSFSSLAFSSCVHAGLLVALGLIVCHAEPRTVRLAPWEMSVASSILPGKDLEDSLATIELEEPEDALQPEAVESEASMADAISSAPRLLVAAPHATEKEPAAGDASESSATAASGAGSLIGGESSEPGGKGPANRFFGLESYGYRIVFVVDISGSMDGTRFRRARTELCRSLEALQENQEFFVIFFSSGALPMPGTDLMPATTANVQDAVRWIKDVECGGGTVPWPALQLALQMRPDAIYMLTDGRFEPEVVQAIQQVEPTPPIPIYTIGFASRSAERLLREISAQTGGVYQFVR